MLNDGHPMIEVVKELQVTEATWYRWLNQYGSEKNTEASKRTKELEKENARLKRLLAEKELSIDILNGLIPLSLENFEPRTPPPRRAHGGGEVRGLSNVSPARSSAKTGLPSGRRNPIRASRRHGFVPPYAPSRSSIRHGMAESPLVPARPAVGWDGAQ